MISLPSTTFSVSTPCPSFIISTPITILLYSLWKLVMLLPVRGIKSKSPNSSWKPTYVKSYRPKSSNIKALLRCFASMGTKVSPFGTSDGERKEHRNFYKNILFPSRGLGSSPCLMGLF